MSSSGSKAIPIWALWADVCPSVKRVDEEALLELLFSLVIL